MAHAQGAAKCGIRQVRPPELIQQKLVFDRNGNTIESSELVWCSVGHAFGARAIVAADVDDQRVIELAQVLDGLDDSADLIVGVSLISPKDIGLLDEELLFVPTQGSHSCNSSGQAVSLASCGHDAKPLLVGEDRIAELVPAIVEQVHGADLVDPFRRGMVRRVCRQERSRQRTVCRARSPSVVSCSGSLRRPSPFRGSRQGCLERIDSGRIAEQVGLPLARVAADKAVEIIKAHTVRPLDRTARPGSTGKRGCCGPCRTTKLRNRSPSGLCRWCLSQSG